MYRFFVKISKDRRALAFLILLVLLLLWLRSRFLPQAVTTITIQQRAVVQTLATTGRIQGGREASLGFEIAGIIDEMAVREGDRVLAGAYLCSLRTGELDAMLELARTQLATAEAEYQAASAGPLVSERARLEAELQRAKEVGDARVQKARQRLQELEAGTRAEDIQTGEADLKRASATRELAQLELNRMQALYDQGAISKSTLDRVLTEVLVAEKGETALAAKLALLQAGPRVEEVAQAKAELQAAEAECKGSQKVAQEALETLLASPRAEVIKAAKSRIEVARAGLAQALEQRSKARLVAPFQGVVAAVFTEIGDSILPGQRILRLTELGVPEIKVETDEQNLRRLRLGQTALITSEALPGKEFEAYITDLGASSNFERGTVMITFAIKEVPAWLRTDLTVDVNIMLGEEELVLLPAEAVKVVNGAATVLMIQAGRVVERAVTLGDSGPEGIVIRKGLKEGERVLANAKLSPGKRVRARGA